MTLRQGRLRETLLEKSSSMAFQRGENDGEKPRRFLTVHLLPLLALLREMGGKSDNNIDDSVCTASVT